MDIQSLLEFAVLTGGFVALLRLRRLRRYEDVNPMHGLFGRSLRERLVHVDSAAFPLRTPNNIPPTALHFATQIEAMYENAPNQRKEAA